ncbi:vesicle transport through interaction with t-SNAREs homolog 1A isoform X2 [Bubalus bubalis]|uniref:vesicle transport through interaction with t-SNAREs homolog 1A isoform X2 n=1 Tax=Bubalus bubalis TaxID=89462 RepID=UPI001E1B7DA2|nr:vesicle transport through interaction with t-SNAREs homolog 1A isoform X2 [Bubalus bubalis]
MSSDFEGYEQDFAVLTAEITNKIARVPRLPPDEKKQMVANVEKQLEEAKELLEQMDLEVREIPPQSRGMYSNRMRSYKQEMGKLETDFKRSRIAYSDEVRNELLGDDGNSSENQRAHLLDNTERLERSSRRLEAGYQIAVETEQIGQEMLENLSHDREKIQRARERLRETDANLGKSSRVLTGMLRSTQHFTIGQHLLHQNMDVRISKQMRVALPHSSIHLNCKHGCCSFCSLYHNVITSTSVWGKVLVFGRERKELRLWSLSLWTEEGFHGTVVCVLAERVLTGQGLDYRANF